MNRNKFLQLITVESLRVHRFPFPERSQATRFGVQTSKSPDLEVTATAYIPRKVLFSRKWWLAQGVFFFHITFFHIWTAGETDTESPLLVSFFCDAVMGHRQCSQGASSSLVEPPFAVVFS